MGTPADVDSTRNSHWAEADELGRSLDRGYLKNLSRKIPTNFGDIEDPDAAVRLVYIRTPYHTLPLSPPSQPSSYSQTDRKSQIEDTKTTLVDSSTVETTSDTDAMADEAVMVNGEGPHHGEVNSRPVATSQESESKPFHQEISVQEVVVNTTTPEVTLNSTSEVKMDDQGEQRETTVEHSYEEITSNGRREVVEVTIERTTVSKKQQSSLPFEEETEVINTSTSEHVQLTEETSYEVENTLSPQTETLALNEEITYPVDIALEETGMSGKSSDLTNGHTDNLLQTDHQEIVTTSERPKSLQVTEEKTQKPNFDDIARELEILDNSGFADSPNTSGLLAPSDEYDQAITQSPTSTDSGTVMDTQKAPGHFVVVAIDFGTTFSGYAFSFTRDVDSIHMMRKWEGGDPGVNNQKTPTILLLKPDGAFHSFGFNARDFYHDLDPQEAKKWLYFEKFKLSLHYSTVLDKNTQIEATNGKKVPAIDIFTYSLKFFKEHALQELSDQSATSILNEDIRWVLTVPAIWREPAKQFMRETAYRAGIASSDNPDQLLIALEPEAASIYCRRIRMNQLIPEAPPKEVMVSPGGGSEKIVIEKVEDLAPESTEWNSTTLIRQSETVGTMVNSQGTRYMVVDCGGGTVDITVHEMETKQGQLKELYKATGGPHGSVGVDIEFELLLKQIFGTDFMESFRRKRPAGYVDLMIAFESRKRAANPFKNNPLNVALPFSFIEYYNKYKKVKGSQVESAIRKYGDKDIKWSSQGMLRLMPEAMRKLFLPTLERINICIRDIITKPECKDIRFLFLVGGFAESPMLQMSIRREFGHMCKVLIPHSVGLSILKGAVMFGIDPSVITLRKSRLTYGVGVLNRFNRKQHPKSKLVKRGGIEWCTDVFDKFVEIDQDVALGETVVRSYTPAKMGQRSSVIHIYCTERRDVKFITDKAVSKCGTLNLELDDDNKKKSARREIKANMTFGDTFIKVTAVDMSTGKTVRSSIDFLNK